MVTQPGDIAFLVGLVVYVSVRHVFAKRTLGEEKIERRVDSLETGLIVVVTLGSLVLPLLYLFTPLLGFADYSRPAAIPWSGLAVMVVALWLFWRSHVDLGLNWSISLEVRKDHRLVQSGVYRRVRHPMYTSIFLWSSGRLLPHIGNRGNA